MLRTIEATIDRNGQVKLIEAIVLPRSSRALVTILEDAGTPNEAFILAEPALAEWLSPAEDEAWRHLAELPEISEEPE